VNPKLRSPFNPKRYWGVSYTSSKASGKSWGKLLESLFFPSLRKLLNVYKEKNRKKRRSKERNFVPECPNINYHHSLLLSIHLALQ